MKRIVVTGASGLLGGHAHAHLHAANCAAEFHGRPKPYEIVALDSASFADQARLTAALEGAQAVLHFAGVNRAPDETLEAANPGIARRLAAACSAAGVAPHIVYSNSTHAAHDTPYGRSKRSAGEILARMNGPYTDMVLPHVFGEGARPFYNNVTATLIHHILQGTSPDINPDGRVNLLHAGTAVRTAIAAVEDGRTGRLLPQAHPMMVPDLHARLRHLHESYAANVFPDLSDPFDLALFNTYRAAIHPERWPRPLTLNTDARGMLFEAVKGGGGQCFLSTTKPGVTRGDHFHLRKVERFVVLQGKAVIRIRRVLTGTVQEYAVSGDAPVAIDMPTLHTHSIENVGADDLLTLFWAQEFFDPANPDTYADKVLPRAAAGA